MTDCFCWRFRCWFGKRAGVYTDYIYQGPMILVLVVRVSYFCPSVAALSSEPVLHNVLIQLVFIMSLKCLAGMKCWKQQHVLHVSDDKCEALTLYLPKLLNLCYLEEIWESFRKNKNEIQGYVQSCLYLLGIISNIGSFPSPQGKFFMLLFNYFISINYCESVCCHSNWKALSSESSSTFSS